MSIDHAERPRTVEIAPAKIPAELKAEASWVCWKHEKRDGKWTKNLRQTNGRQAASDDPSTWTTFEAAMGVAGRFDGIGFVFHEGNTYAGADMDGVTEDQARGWLDRFDSYAERSPSGNGFHIICKAELPDGTKRAEGELYSSGRFFTVTGDVVRDKPVAERQSTAEEYYRYLRRKDPGNNKAPIVPSSTSLATDDQVIEKLLHESSGKGRVLFGGDVSGYESHSSADQAFMNKLFFWTQDLDQIDAIWRRSGMYREKWERPDYRRRTYMKAANHITETYEWGKREISVGSNSTNPTNSANPTNPTNPANPANPANPMVKSAAKLLETKMEPTRWAVPGVLPEGVSILAGKPKKGKSWMALGLCEAIAAGGVALGSRRVDKGETLYLALEDNERRMQKRLKKVLDGRTCPEGLHYAVEWPRAEEGGTEALDEWLHEHPDARLVVIDTLQKIRTPQRGKNGYAEDYGSLEGFMPIAARHQVAVLVVHHLRKGESDEPVDLISGTLGLAGGVDGWLILARKPGAKGPILHVDGRDVDAAETYALHWNENTAGWTIEGTAEEVHLSQERADILLVLNRSPEPMTPKETADLLGRKANNVKYLMWQMAQDGQLAKPAPGKYEPTNRTNPTTNRETPHANADNDDSVSGVSEVSKDRPVSWDLEPGESATVEELQAQREWEGTF